ncbi:MAG: hypothetical protein HY674_14945, partial [Chloroflexi bacterium]|nr:hypothetical protein [Chloroflexota bacterium]
MNGAIRKVAANGVVTTLAGVFSAPEGVAVDSASNVYVADTENHTVRRISAAGVVTTLAGLDESSGTADGTGSTARFHDPTDVAVDSAGNVYVADIWNNTIRKVTPDGVVTTLAGLAQDTDGDGGNDGAYADGPGAQARFNWPYGIAVDHAGNLYVTDGGNNVIRQVNPAGVVTTWAGAARFGYPSSVAVDSGGNVYLTDAFYRADGWNHTIQK